ncbi:hypothetical protein A4X09_0g4773 [Tilletia walkeri]|uniref:Zn(2)-C6 fungal-type domain-containing protein n=1 Tax=Tilletia walkeri TaxID=117179 RepID=A0A8X7T3Z3_9BASI|nr:hypothetical protein A4X09_0g4773 [Tilletia walkeri]
MARHWSSGTHPTDLPHHRPNSSGNGNSRTSSPGSVRFASTSTPQQQPSLLHHSSSPGLSSMNSGWGPPPSLQRMASSSASGSLYPPPHGLSHSPASSNPLQAHPPPLPPIRALTGYDGAEDDRDDEDEEEEDDDEDEDDNEDDDDASMADMSTASKKRKRKNSSMPDAQNPATAGGPSTSTSQSHNPGEASSSNLAEEPVEKKPKVSRGSKACTNCRRLKMRCVPSTNEGGHPCKRCLSSGGSCVFEVSQRGKRTSKGKRTEAMAASLKKMEETLNSVLRSIRDPAGSGGGAIDLAPSTSLVPDFANPAGMSELPRSPFDQFAPALPRVSSAPVVSGRLAPGASPGGQHINPASLTAAAAAGVSASASGPPGHSSSRSSHGGSQAAALSPEQERAAGGGGGSGSGGSGPASASYDRSRGADASSASGSSQHHDPHHHHHHHHHHPLHHQRLPTKSSPRLHSLPDNTLNPLGLLAEASLHNTERASRRAAAAINNHRRGGSLTSSREGLLDDGEEAGISPAAASDRSAPAGDAAGVTGAGDDLAPRDKSQVRGRASTTGGAAEGAVSGKKTEGKARAASSAGATATLLVPGNADDGDEMDDPDDGTKAPRFVRPNNDLSRALGVASSSYFKPGPLSNLPLRRVIIEREIPPKLLTQGIISSEEILELFQIFFHYCSVHVVLLDPEMHTPALICARSPFLFSAVCCVASRYYSHKRPDLYAKCLAEAKRCAFDIMHRGYKSVEIVQGFLLLSMWNQPSERYETDKTWLFSGVAMRMATDLNLHRKSVLTLPPDMSPNDPIVLEREREILNRERTWYICFTMDRALSAQMGKPYTIREDFLTRNCKYWCEQRVSRPWDLAVSGLVDLLRLTSRMLDMLYSSTLSVNGLNLELDYSTMLRIWNEQLDELRDQWSYKGVFPGSFRLQADPFGEIKARMAAQRAHITLASPIPGAGGAGPSGRGGSAAQGAGNSSSQEGAERAPGKGAADGSGAARNGGDAGAGESKHPAASEGSKHDQRILYFCVQQAPLRWHNAVLIINSFGLQRALDLGSDDKNYFFIKCLTAAKGMLDAALTGLRPVLRYAPDAQFVMISYACVFLLKLLRKEFRGWIDEEEVISLISTVIDLLDEVAVNETHTPALNATFLRRLLNARAETRPGSPYASAYHSRAATPAAGGGHDAGLAMTGLEGGAATAAARGDGSTSHVGLGAAGMQEGFGQGFAQQQGNLPINTSAAEASLAGLGVLPTTSVSAAGATPSAFSNFTSLLGPAPGSGSGLTAAPMGQQRFSGFSPNISFADDPHLNGENSSSSAAAFPSSSNAGFQFLWADENHHTMHHGGDAAPAAAFGVSSLAQLFPSNMGFSGSGAPADSSHAASMHVSGAGSASGVGAGAEGGGGGPIAGPGGHGASGAGTHVGGAHHHHHHHSTTATAGGNANNNNSGPTTTSSATGGGGGSGATAHHSNLTESVFDDNFWSTLLPPGFGSSGSLSGSGWDFQGVGGNSGLNMGFGMGLGQMGGTAGMGAGPGAWTTVGGSSTGGGGGSGAASGGAGAGGVHSNHAGGSGAGAFGLGMNMTPTLGGNGEDGHAAAGSASKGAGGGGARTSVSGNNGNGNGGAGGRPRGSTPSAVGAFNF